MVKIGPPMAPDPVKCPSPGCPYSTPEGLPDFTLITEHLCLHGRLAHPPVAAPAQPAVGAQAGAQAAKLDKKVRPCASLGISELQWRFFVSEWSRYTRQTGIHDQVLRDEL